ncbi:hypothetical protein L227DRAFT_22164 [Lentinus tigrinus ALCF2SS1-6]|uniref:F-box domain-containing protein n=1 Tax=Lentinus tigrinus ALCF2SS1-6 TaxID=1328759 RepID=A0A5C2SWJ2_9APHY|nr:hypothetical protein L227DRAFT_22164 [Lentinus tigrinus ALCF2SS1-6]
MENLAPELLDSIFTLACTDGGFTGCSLSSVSKHVRATSRGARFYSISLTRARLQMTQFLSCFLAERAVASIYTPTIRHLHIVSIKNDKPRGGAPGDEVKPDRRIVDETAEYVENVAQLFRLVAQNLETLSLVHYHGWLRLVPLLAIECPAGGFPMLRELTIVGSDPFVAKGTALSPFYPRLARLHVGFPTHFPWDMSLVDWATRAPGITHLCLSEVNGASPAIEDLAGLPLHRCARSDIQALAVSAPATDRTSVGQRVPGPT